MIAVSWISPIQIHTRDSTSNPPTVNSSPLTSHTIFCSQSLCFIRIVLTCYLSAWIHLKFLFQLNLRYLTLAKNFFDAYKLVNIKHWILSIVSANKILWIILLRYFQRNVCSNRRCLIIYRVVPSSKMRRQSWRGYIIYILVYYTILYCN